MHGVRCMLLSTVSGVDGILLGTFGEGLLTHSSAGDSITLRLVRRPPPSMRRFADPRA